MDYIANKRKQHLTEIRRANTLRIIRGQQILNEEEELDKLLGKMPVKEKPAAESVVKPEDTSDDTVDNTTDGASTDGTTSDTTSDTQEEPKEVAPKKTEIDEAASDEIEAENAATEADVATAAGDAEVAPEATETDGNDTGTSDAEVDTQPEASTDEASPDDTTEADTTDTSEGEEADPVASLPTIDDEVLKPKMLQFVDRILESDSDEDRADILLLIYRAGIKSGMEFAKPTDSAKKVEDQPEAQ